MSKDAFAILLALAGLAGLYAVITGRVTIQNGALAFNFGTPGTGLSVNRGSGTNNTSGAGVPAASPGDFGSYASASGTAGAVLAIAPPAITLSLPSLPQLDNVNAIA